MPDARPWLLALILLAISLVLLVWCCRHGWRHALPRLAKRLRRLHPRTPDDCPLCRLAATSPQDVPPRRVPTEGYACRNPRCCYYGNTDAQLHALVAAGHQGRTEQIQQILCQACGAKVSARWGTALAHLKTPPGRIGEVLSALAEGLDVGAVVRVFGHGETTITRWRTRATRHADRVRHRFPHGLHLPHLQFDEIRTRLRARERVTWLWLALDPRTKLIPALAVGPRTQHTAHTLVHTVRAALTPDCTPVITTDGLRLYFYAITAHFGYWVAAGRRRRRWQVHPSLLYGQLRKRYQRRRLVRIKYQMQCGSHHTLRSRLRGLGWSGKLQTAFVERVNLTARQSVAALTRRTWATAQTATGMQQQLDWWRGYYHFVRPHLSLHSCGRARTPAMAASLTAHRWTAVEFLGYPCAESG